FIAAEKQQHAVARGEADDDASVNQPGTAPVQIKSRAKIGGPPAPIQIVREAGGSTNPLILILAIPGIVFLTGRYRVIYGATAAWLVLLGAGIGPLKPQLELDRMLVMFSVLAAVPVAYALLDITRLAFHSEGNSWYRKVTASAIGSFLIISPFAL